MTNILIVSVHRIGEGRSGEAVHLRRLAEALRDVGERVTTLDGPMDPGRTTGHEDTGLRELGYRLDRLLGEDRPEVALLWGHRGEEAPVARRLHAAGVPVVLEHPAADIRPTPETLQLASEIVVPSRFARRLLAQESGRAAHAIEPCLRQCACPPGQPGRGADRQAPYRLTFVNPEPAKGLGVVMHLVSASSAARLPFLFRFVEGRWTAADLAELGIRPANLPCLEIVPHRGDVCSLYAETDLLLAPSLWRESFGMVAREAVIHGVPVVASRSGGLPEAVGGGGVCLAPPAHFGNYRVRMTVEETRTWLEAVARGLRRGRTPQPELLTRTTAASVGGYRKLLTGLAGARATVT